MVLAPSSSTVAYIICVALSLQIKQMLDNVLSNATNDFNFNDTSFLPLTAQEALDEFRNASVEQINITGEITWPVGYCMSV